MNKRLVYKATLTSVDGQYFFQFMSNKAGEILKFYQRFGHEGDSFSLTVDIEYSEDVFKFLEEMNNNGN